MSEIELPPRLAAIPRPPAIPAPVQVEPAVTRGNTALIYLADEDEPLRIPTDFDAGRIERILATAHQSNAGFARLGTTILNLANVSTVEVQTSQQVTR